MQRRNNGKKPFIWKLPNKLFIRIVRIKKSDKNKIFEINTPYWPRGSIIYSITGFSYCSPWLFSTSIEASSSKLIGHRLTYLVSQRPNTCKTGVRLNHKSDVPIGCIEKEIKKAWGDTSHLVTDYERRKLLRVLIRVVKCHRETSKNSFLSFDPWAL